MASAVIDQSLSITTRTEVGTVMPDRWGYTCEDFGTYTPLWENFVGNWEVMSKVSGSGVQYFKEESNRNKLRWLGRFSHVHRRTASLYAVLRGR